MAPGQIKHDGPHKDYLSSLNKPLKELTKEERREYNRLYEQVRIKRNGKSYDATKQAEWMRIWRSKPENKAKIAAYCKDYHSKAENKAKVNSYVKEYNKRHEVKERRKLRNWITNALRRVSEDKVSWQDNIGCSRDEFIAHIESLFQEGMTWDNWTIDGWHLDHIKPVSKGGSNHYTNLQPLWAKDNISKSDKEL